MTPILIPAKNIYRKNYEKLLDNVIQLVQVNAKNKKETAYAENIYEDFVQGYYVSSEYIEKNGRQDSITKIVSVVLASIQPFRKTIQVVVNKDINLSYISQPEDIVIELVTKVEKGRVSASAYLEQGLVTNWSDFILKEDLTFTKESENLQSLSTLPTSETAEATFVGTPTGVKTTSTLPEEETSKTFSYIEYNEYFTIQSSFFCGVKKYNLSYATNALVFPSEFTMSGTYEFFEPYQIKIYIKGVLVKTEFIDATEMFGNTTSKQSYVVDGNELLTQDNYFTDYSQEVFDTPLPERYKTILEEYKNGKKKLTLLCDINDYYYYDATKPDKKGSIAISRNLTRLTFKEYDEVIPMIKLANGDYVPIAKNEDGTPMVFVVLAIRVFYDGVVWQELTLQQK